jgi:Mrp family chromosome partitioning ATPase
VNPRLTIVVAGFDELAVELASTGYFVNVIPVQSTSGLRSASRVELKGIPRADVLFFFADNLTVDTPQDLEFLLGRLVGMGYTSVVCDVVGGGRALVAANPGAGLISAPFHTNKALGAMAALGFSDMEPVQSGHAALDPFALGAPAQSHEPAPAPAAESTGWGRPQGVAEPAQNQPVQNQPVQNQPVQNQPAQNQPADSWGAPDQASAPAPFQQMSEPPAPTSEDSWGAPAPAAAPAPFQQMSAPAAPTQQAPAGGGGLSARATGAAGGGGGLSARQNGTPFSGGLAPRSGAVAAGNPTGRRGKVIAVGAPKGGVGKSSLTLNIAGLLATLVKKSGKTVCVVDANFQNGDTGKYLDRYDPTVKDLLERATSFSPEIVGQYLITHNTYRFSALLAPPTPIDGNPTLISGKVYSRIVDVLREMFDYIIVDTPVAELYHDIFDNFVLPQADYLIVAAGPNEATLLNISLYLQSICSPKHSGGRGFDENKVGVFLNRAEEDIGCDVDTARNAVAQWQWLGHVPETKEWKLANNKGQLVIGKNLPHINKRLISMLALVTQDPDVIEADNAGVTSSSRKGGLFAKLRQRAGA